MSSNFHLQYRGERNYVAGVDLYSGMVRQLLSVAGIGTIENIKFSVHKFIRNQCEVFIEEVGKPSAQAKRSVAELVAQTSVGRLIVRLVETDAPISEKFSFDEDRIARAAKASGTKIEIFDAVDFSPIEVAVSLTKQLHYSIFPTKKKWIFTRLELHRPFREGDDRNLAIEFKRGFHDKLTQSEVWVGGNLIGHIYFSAVSPEV